MATTNMSGYAILVFLFGLAVLALFVIVLMGQYYLTALSFGHTSSGTARTYELEQWQVSMLKIATVMFWVLLGLAVIGGSYMTNRYFMTSN